MSSWAIAALLPGSWWASALVLARAAGLAWTAPALATPALGARMRVILAALLAAAVTPAVGLDATAEAAGLSTPSAMQVGRAALAEAAIGAALGFSAALVIAGARQAGEVVGLQAGLSAAALFDPEAGDELTPMGHLYALVALAAFLALDGPLAAVEALATSYRVIPAGGLALSSEVAPLAAKLVGEALSLCLRAAAPAALALALAGVALGMLNRAAPSLQLVALALPVRFAVGLIFAMLGLAALAATCGAAWGGWLALWGGG